MIHPLYWVAALTYAIPLVLILIHDRRMLRRQSREEQAFRRLLLWVIFFCVQDIFWGLTGSLPSIGDLPLFIASTVFHASTVTTTYFWLDYVLTFLGDRIRYRRVYLALDGVVLLVQYTLLVINFFVPTIFSVRGGIYFTEFLRPLAFANQYMVYLLIGLLTLFKAVATHGETRRKHFTVFCFALAPILTGVFQLLYPDAPFYSIGYFLGTIIIHLFIVQSERSEMQTIQHEMENRNNQLRIAEQILLSNTDRLTDLPNRRAYEDALPAAEADDDLCYVSVDVNELKVVNDSLGHAAGDELLIGAAACLQEALGAAGKVYRTGGDEFVGLLHADRQQLQRLIEQLNRQVDVWQGQSIRSLSLSLGAASRDEFPGVPVSALAHIADERMYRSKTAYYLSRGIDRQGQHKAYFALCASYAKILRVDLTADAFQIISMDEAEKTEQKGYASSFSQWLHDFGTSGQVHPDDLPEYLRQTDRSRLTAHFASGKRYLGLFYRRRIGPGFRQALMELIPAENYEPHHQHLYLYVKDIDRSEA